MYPIKSTVEPTPGNWKSAHGCVWAHDETEFVHGMFIDRTEPKLVATIYGKESVAGDDPHVVANTNLIAAAKDLLEVAESIASNEALSSALRKKARAAVRKAKGIAGKRS
jgi:hypothetical protein